MTAALLALLALALVVGLGALLVVLPEIAEARAKRERLAVMRTMREGARRKYSGPLTPLGKSTIIIDTRRKHGA